MTNVVLLNGGKKDGLFNKLHWINCIFPNACLQINSLRSPGVLVKMTFLLPPFLSAVGRGIPLSNKQLR